jgi:hypothetical protein
MQFEIPSTFSISVQEQMLALLGGDSNNLGRGLALYAAVFGVVFIVS